MTRLSNTVNQFDMSWDEYVIAVEDSYLIEAEADLTDEQYRDVSTAFDIGIIAQVTHRCRTFAGQNHQRIGQGLSAFVETGVVVHLIAQIVEAAAQGKFRH